KETINKNKEHLIKSVDLRMRSDVPLAFCLSGGIDSGSIVSIASKVLGKKVNCFSIIDDDEKYNEYDNISKIVKDCGVKHHPIFLKYKKDNFFSKIEKLIDYHDSPISTISYFIHSYLLEDISSKKFKVSITGTGADEMYTGYYDHYLQYFASVDQSSEIFKNNLKFWEKYIKPSLRNPAFTNKNFYKENPKSMFNVFEENFELKNFSKSRKSYSSIKEKNFTENVLRNRMLNEMFHEIVPVILKHDDHNAMMNSVENRSPFLDKELLNFTFQIPTEYLIQNGFQKFILRESMKDILIDSVRLDRKKRGFNASINSLINFKDTKNIDIIFSEKNIINEFVDLEKLKKSIDFSQIPNHFSKFLFSIINSEIFLRKNF
ncbi:asparagine synthase C-terminal domain-containing protein, partial [bacterium]|nr:asparagine synthase C-terminal domain-containing protein [bacterium]